MGKRITVAILCVVLGLALILLIGIGLSGVLGEPAPQSSKVGVARTGGHLVVYGCTDDGIGSIEIQAGAKPRGRLLWSAVKNAGAPGSRTIALDASVAGYSVRGTVAVDVAGQVLALRAITDSHGVTMTQSYVVIRPKLLADGEIMTTTGRIEALSDWLAKTGTC